MASNLLLVYGFVADPSLLIIDFEKVIVFDLHTRAIGIIVQQKSAGDFIYPDDFDEDIWRDRYESYLNTLVAEVIEVEGDLVSPSKRDAWEKKLRRQHPRMFVGIKS